MTVTGRPRSTRETVLRAASDVILTQGVSALTLDEVARVAGVSKGGLLYHFRTKNALVSGMLVNLIAEFEGALHEELLREGDNPHPGVWHRAYIRATFDHEQLPAIVISGLLAAVATEPELLAPIHKKYAEWAQHAQTDGLDPALATIIRMATDNLVMAHIFRLAPPEGQLRSQVAEMLVALTVRGVDAER